MPPQTPTVGRVVNFHAPECFQVNHQKDQPFPAIITHVHNDNSVNLRVFEDAEFGKPSAHVIGRAPRCEAGEAKVGHWSWPVMVGASSVGTSSPSPSAPAPSASEAGLSSGPAPVETGATAPAVSG